MASPEKDLTLSTVDTTWVKAAMPNTNNPYKRVVGIEFGGVVLRGINIYYPEYSDSVIEQHKIQVTNRFGGRLFGFYKRHFTQRSPNVIPNCFDFAAWMDGADLLLGKNLGPSYEYAVAIRKSGEEMKQPTPLGNYVALAPKRLVDDLPKALHSVVSLGENRDQCLQVMSDSMFSRIMGIDSYENILEYYQRLQGNTDKDLAFYVR